MLRFGGVLFRARSIHPKAFTAAAEARSSELRASLAAAHKHLKQAVVLEDLEAAVPVSGTSVVTARDLWHASCVARKSKHTRRSQGACVVGGAKAIRRVWREYRIRPHVVYVPNTEKVLPGWCTDDDEGLPTYLVRSSPVEIKRQLLSAEHSDGYAAEFPWGPSLVAPASTLLAVDGARPRTAESGREDERGVSRAVGSMVVLIGLRIPSNAGLLIRAAVDLGYESVLLVDCVDPFHEKVVRASEGTVFSPHLRVYEAHSEEGGGGDLVGLLSGIAARHRLLPLLAVPSQEADQAFDVAKRFHLHNATARAGEGVFGAMLVLGSESEGLRSLGGSEWRVPHQVVTLPLPNPEIDSLNVTVAGSVLLNLFRRGAEPHFSQLLQLTGESAEALPSFRHRRAEEEEERQQPPAWRSRFVM